MAISSLTNYTGECHDDDVCDSAGFDDDFCDVVDDDNDNDDDDNDNVIIMGTA